MLFCLAVYYQPQQPQPQQTQQLRQQKQQQPQQQPEEPQQVPVAPLLKTQPRESKRASRRARSSALRIVDVSTNRDVLTGEEVFLPSVTPTTTSTLHFQPLHHHLQPLPEIVAAGVVSASVVAPDEVEARALTATVRAPSTTEYVRLKYVAYGNTFKKIGNTGIKYSRENPLGQGTYGSVYLGIYNDQQVAVKRIELKQSKKEEREADLQQNLDHENVLKILKVEEDDDFRYD